MELSARVINFIIDFFTRPMVWQRVIVSGILAFLIAYESSSGKPIHTSIDMFEASFFVIFPTFWIIFSGTSELKDFTRIFLSVVYGILTYGVIVIGASVASAGVSVGWVFFSQLVSFMSIAIVSLFAVTGHGPNELFQMFKETHPSKPYIASNANSTNNSSSHTG